MPRMTAARGTARRAAGTTTARGVTCGLLSLSLAWTAHAWDPEEVPPGRARLEGRAALAGDAVRLYLPVGAEPGEVHRWLLGELERAVGEIAPRVPVAVEPPLTVALEPDYPAAHRAKSERLTGYLEFLLDRLPPGRVEVITPRDPARRGCQLSMLVHDRPRELLAALEAEGVVCDFREPNVIRVAPVPLYNTFHEVWTFADVLARQLG